MAAANPLHIIFVGAGLGGLAAAIATRQAGHNVTICEQAPALGEVCIISPGLPSIKVVLIVKSDWCWNPDSPQLRPRPREDRCPRGGPGLLGPPPRFHHAWVQGR